jgi:PTH1 family peptidyl-tRNA hydrolase
VKSVTAHAGGPGYVRVRMGIGRPPGPMDPADYVLGKFPRGEDRQVEECVAWAVEAAKTICELGAVKAMNQFNRRTPPA